MLSLSCIDSTNNFYAYKSNEGLYRSTNYGATWTHVHGQIGSGIELTGFVASKNGNLFTLEYSSTGVYRSTDLGVTWDTVAQILTTSFPMNLVIDTSGYLYVGCYAYGGIFRSDPIMGIVGKIFILDLLHLIFGVCTLINLIESMLELLIAGCLDHMTMVLVGTD